MRGSEFRSQSQPRRGLRRTEAAAYVGISPTKFDQLVTDGRMPQPKIIDGCKVWDIRSLDRAFDQLPGGHEDEQVNEWDEILYDKSPSLPSKSR